MQFWKNRLFDFIISYWFYESRPEPEGMRGKYDLIHLFLEYDHYPILEIFLKHSLGFLI